MSTLRETYKGAEISYDENANKWHVDVDDRRISTRDSLKNARGVVDDLGKVEEKFSRHAALYREGWGAGPLCPCTVTSYTTDPYGVAEAWISFVSQVGLNKGVKPQRTKVEISRLFEDTPENQERIRQCQYLKEQEDIQCKKRTLIFESITHYKLRK